MKSYLIPLVIIALAGVLYNQRDSLQRIALQPNDSSFEEELLPIEKTPEVIVSNLQTPWEFLSLPSGDLLITERPGNVILVKRETGERQTVHTSSATETSEGGLLGMALDPFFETNARVFLYESYRDESRTLLNRVVSYLFVENSFTEETILIDGIPGAEYHDGGRIAFGPDSILYVTTGDATEPELAQDLSSLAGKILRLNVDGSVPDDNPFEDSFVYSYGHRNPQGLAWDELGRLWSTEHGPSGIESGHDELNIIVAGGNYGWPYFAGEVQQVSRELNREEYRFPVIESGESETWAPASLVYTNNTLYFGGLRGQALYRVPLIEGSIGQVTRLLFEEFGRIRTVQVFEEGSLYFSTSNTDGRGYVNEGDDKIVRIPIGE